MLRTLRKPANEGRVWIVEGGLLEFNLLKNGQITIHSILSTKPGVGSHLLKRLLDHAREHGATSIFAKCPTNLESNSWYEKKGFTLESVEDPKSKSGRKLNCWRLSLVDEAIAATAPRDGFLYHHGGSSPIDQLERLIADEPNLGFDDLFAATIEEADEAILAAEKERKKLLERLKDVRQTLLLKRAHRSKVKQAIQTYRDTGEIGEALIPECRRLAAERSRIYAEADAVTKAEELQAAKEALRESVGEDWYDPLKPEGGVWMEHDSRVDDHYVYVTVKRRREIQAPERPSNDEIKRKVRERIRQAFETYRPDFKNRVRPIDFMATPASPRAP